MKNERPDVVILAAAKVGGILANNTYPAQFIYENIIIQANVIHQAFEAGVEKLLFLGSQFTCRETISEIFTLVLIFSKKAEEKDI